MIKTRKAYILPIAIIACVMTFCVVTLFAPSRASAEVSAGGKTVTAVAWQCKKADGDSYAWQTYETALQLEYSGADLSDSVRAVLTFDDGTSGNVYAQGVEVEDGNALSDLHLDFVGTFNGEAVTTPYNATTYAVTLSDGTQTIDGYSTTLEVAPTVLGLTAADFEWSEGKSERLWLANSEGITTTLLGRGVKFYDPDADSNVGTGSEDDAYAAYRGNNISLLLNADYVVGERTLKTYLDNAEITYVDNSAVGDATAVNTIHTIARLTFNGNYVSQEGSAAAVLELEKTWYIVTVRNTLRAGDGSETPVFEDLHFGEEHNLIPMRGEHGDSAVYVIRKNGSYTTENAFAAVFGDNGIEYYGAKRGGAGGYEADLSVPLAADYYNEFFYTLGAGEYELAVYLPEYRIENEHTHWWDDTDSDETELYIVYHASQYAFNFTVSAYALDNGNGGFNDGIVLEFDDEIAVTYYTGAENNIPALTITLNGKPLVNGVDYELSSADVNVGAADLTVRGIGGLDGIVELKGAFRIIQSINTWVETPNVVNWIYGSFDPIVNTITATPLFPSKNGVKFSVATDRAGANAIEGLESFCFTDGELSDEVLKLLRELNVGSYYLFARVDKTDNYTSIEPGGVSFQVFKAVNMWTETPHIASWVYGSYSATDNAIKFGSLFGQARFVIKDKDGNVYYDSIRLFDNLKNAGVGSYTLTAVVDGATNYSALAEYTFNFEIYPKQGMPWWGVLLIVLGVLIVLGIVILILLKLGVIQLLTSKVAVKIRTNASIDATIASIRVAKMEEESKASIAKAKAKDRAKERRAAAKNTTAEEKAAAAEAKAQAAAERAAKARIRAEVLQEKAARMRMTAAEETAPVEPTGEEAPQTEQAAPSEE